MELHALDEQNLNKIEILSTEDEKLKNLGEVLGSDNGRLIFKTICDVEMTAIEIANKTNLSLELVRYHLKKLLSVGFIAITKIEKNSREQDMKYYRSTKFALMIVLPTVIDQAKKSKSLISSINKIYRFMVIGAAGFVSWFVTNSFYATNDVEPSKIGAPFSSISSEPWFSTSVALSVIVIGLLIERALITRSKH